jgi:cysteinyl-tRNA synthetase
MPVITRSQYRLKVVPECTRQFKDTLENPCVLQVILGNLNQMDIANMKCLSKDERYNDVIDMKLKEIKEDKKRISTVTNYIKKRLNKCERIRATEKKLKSVIEIYEYICENIWFIRRFKVFNDVVHNKLFQLISEHPPFKENGLKYLEKIYDLKPPKDYYDSQKGRLRYGMIDKNGTFVDMEK